MDKIKAVEFHQPSSTILFGTWWPHTQISPHVNQKMRKGCRNDYIEVFGAVYWGKKKRKKKF